MKTGMAVVSSEQLQKPLMSCVILWAVFPPLPPDLWPPSIRPVKVGVRIHFIFIFHFHALEKEMATHSSVLAWRIPGTGELGGLLSMGSHREASS